MTAVTLHARPTRHFNSKLQETLSLVGMVVSAYARATSDTSPCVVQASSLPISVYRPQAEAMVQLAAREGGEAMTQRELRFRTVGDITCSCPVASLAEEPTNTLGTHAIGRVALSLHEPTPPCPTGSRAPSGLWCWSTPPRTGPPVP